MPEAGFLGALFSALLAISTILATTIDKPMKNLKVKTMKALSWSLIESAGNTGIGLVLGIILARLLAPEHYGLIGMLMVFINLGGTLVDSGFGAALVQRQKLTEAHVCSVFFFNVIVATGIAGLLYAVAPLVAAFYGREELTPMTRALSLGIVVNSLGIVHARLLAKRLDFRTQAKISLLTTSVSGSLGIFMAFRGYGVWSLVTQQLCASGLRTAMLWMGSPWRPSFAIRLHALREMFPFGSKVLTTGLVNTLAGNVSRVLIGKFYSAADLGFVERANSVTQSPFTNTMSAVGRVIFPSFSIIQHDNERLKTVFKRTVGAIALLGFPMVVGLVVMARPLVLALFTAKWEPTIPYLRVSALDFFLYPLYTIHLSLWKACGRADLILRLETLKRSCAVLAVVMAARWGILAMLWAHLGVSVIAYGMVAAHTAKLIGQPLRQQVRDLLPHATAAGILAAAMYALQNVVPFENPWNRLVLTAVVGSVFYGILCSALHLPFLRDLAELLKTLGTKEGAA